MWQTPKFTRFPDDPKGHTWYGPIAVGHNPHESFVSRCANTANPHEFKYTNHCLRVTAITNLKWKKWGNKQVKSVSGHKSDSSLEIYEKVL